MKKEILLLWFGDNKPAYVDWNVENFKKMNPTWDVKYVEFSSSQIINDSGDEILSFAINKAKNDNQLSYASISDRYRMKYIDMYGDGIITYFDVDCFPIAPLDDFFVYDTKNLNFITNDDQDARGYWINSEKTLDQKDIHFGIKDIWFLYKINNSSLKSKCYNRTYIFNQFIKSIDMHQPISYYDQFIVNANNQMQVNEIENAKNNFISCKLAIGSSICNAYFSPVEHYHQCERKNFL